MKLKKTILTIIAVMSIAPLLSACGETGSLSGDGTSSSRQTDEHAGVHINKINYKKFKREHPGQCWKLAYVESFFDSADTNQGHYDVGYYQGGKIHDFTLNTHDDHFRIVIVPGLATPFMYKTSGSDGSELYYIYRAPYQQYNTPIIKGKVIKKAGK